MIRRLLLLHVALKYYCVKGFVMLQICMYVLVPDLFHILFTLGPVLTGLVKRIRSWNVLDANFGFTVGEICEYQPKIICEYQPKIICEYQPKIICEYQPKIICDNQSKIIGQRIYSLNPIKKLIFIGGKI